jgi:hypothetical protein
MLPNGAKKREQQRHEFCPYQNLLRSSKKMSGGIAGIGFGRIGLVPIFETNS